MWRWWTLLWGAWLLGACPGDPGDDSGERGSLGSAGTSAATTGSCPARARCWKPCGNDLDCNKSGGYACLRSDDGQDRSPASMSTSPARVPSMSSIATDADAGPISSTTGQSTQALQEPGYCDSVCSTELCADPHAVCSKPDGSCTPGCDKSRPSCEQGQVCDFEKKKCFALEGNCRSDLDCPLFDARLRTRGAASCEDERCRYHPKSPDALRALQFAVPNTQILSVNISAPQAGTRFAPDEVATFVFHFDVPAPVIVASVLTRPIQDLNDGENAAVWTAYVDRKDAVGGITLAQGGLIRDGKWQRYTEDEVPALPKGQLYLFVLGYEHGQLVAASELVPFSVGDTRLQEGTDCVDSQNGWFCAQDSALLCADRVCRMPCLSDDDCSDGRYCSQPGVLPNIQARLCL